MKYTLSFVDRAELTDQGINNSFAKVVSSIRPIVGEVWHVPVDEYPYQASGELKDEDIIFAMVEIVKVFVESDGYYGATPMQPGFIVLCKIVFKGDITEKSFLSMNVFEDFSK